LILLAVVGAVAVFMSVTQYVADVRAEVGDKVPVMRLTHGVAENEEVPFEAVEEVLVPARWISDTALPAGSDLTGLVAAGDLPAGSYLQEGMLKEPPEIQPGEREIAILVDADTGVAGKIGPGNFVDIWATFPATEVTEACSAVVVPRAKIIQVGFELTQPVATEQGGFTDETVVPVTFAMTPPYIRRLVLAESFASEVRLALVNALDVNQLPPTSGCGPSALSRPVPKTPQLPVEEEAE
jgi:pilus assembly protein CpaB